MLIVSKASAGSGKTFALALVYIRFMLRSLREEHIPNPYRHILAVTFTKKATAEMKERIIRELYTLATSPLSSPFLDYLLDIRRLEDEGRLVHRMLTEEERQNEAATLSKDCQTLMANLLQDYPAFQVSTIDSFFQQVIRQFAAELGLTTHYNVSLDDKQIIAEGIDRLFFDINEGEHDTENAFKQLFHYADSNISGGNNWNPKESLRRFADELMHENVQRNQSELSVIATHPEMVSHLKQQLSEQRKAIETLWRTPKGKPDEISKKAPQDTREQYNSIVLALEHLDDLSMLAAVEAKIDERNRTEGRIPISATNMLLNQIIGGTDTPFVYEKIGTRLNHYLIDEFQDTSRLQWDNFRPLIMEASSQGYDNLVVGDVKQSIYRWRNSDMRILQDIATEGLPLGSPLPKTYNYRTSATIVEANNLLFERYAASLYTGEDPKAPLVKEAYEGMMQEPVKKSLSGRYRLEWFNGDKDTFISCALQRTSDTIRQLQKEGRIKQLSEVAVLVRMNKEAARVSEHLISQGIAVQSQEGLYIESHPAVKYLLAMMRLVINPDDTVSAAIIAQFTSQTTNQTKSITQEGTTNLTPTTSGSDLFTFVRNCIDSNKLYKTADADAYLTAFLDIIYDYSIRKNADISGFLDYWKSRSTPPCIPASQAPDAVQIMTIHKSKGLEFPVVIIPMLSWSLGPDRKFSDSLLWCPTAGLPEPFSDIPLLPIAGKKKAAESYFARFYQREEEMLYIDSINLTYVAFTRPIHTLYAFAPAEPFAGSGITVGTWLMPLFEDKQQLDPDNNSFYWEESDSPSRSSKKHASPNETAVQQRSVRYISVPENGRLRRRSPSLRGLPFTPKRRSAGTFRAAPHIQGHHDRSAGAPLRQPRRAAPHGRRSARRAGSLFPRERLRRRFSVPAARHSRRLRAPP